MATLQETLFSLAKSWQQIDLVSVRSELDKVGGSIAEAHERGKNARKQLAESTKEARKQFPDAMKSINSLVKEYQDEIDHLTKRAKQAETSFLGAYEALSAIQDPSAVLMSVAEVVGEVKDLKNQESAVRRLEEELKDAKEAVYQEMESLFADREKSLMMQLSDLQKRYAATENQLFMLRSTLEKAEESGKSRVEYMEDQLRNAEEELAALRSMHGRSHSGGSDAAGADGSVGRLGYERELESARRETEAELERKETELGSLRQYVSKLENDLAKEKIEAKHRDRSLQSEIGKIQFELSQSRQEVQLLRSQKDEADALRKRLAMFQSLHGVLQGGGGDVEEVDFADTISETGSVLSIAASEHQFQQQKKKIAQLESELVRYRIASTSVTEELSQVKRDRELRVSELSACKDLIKRLEDDMATLRSATVSVSEDQTARQTEILTAQRDRLKQRVVQLEQEAMDLQEEFRRRDAQIDILKGENARLSDRLRGGTGPGLGVGAASSSSSSSSSASAFLSALDFSSFLSSASGGTRGGNSGGGLSSDRRLRYFLTVYILLLHLFVMYVVMRFIHASTPQVPPR
eukprot:ANDGO_00340.mRNA.1 Protein CASP